MAASTLSQTAPACADEPRGAALAPDFDSTEGTPQIWGPGIGLLTASWLTSTLVYFGATFQVLGCGFMSDSPDDPHVQACEREHDEKKERAAPVMIPLAGPFIASTTIPDDGRVSGALIALGAVEAAAVGMIVSGLAWRHEVPPKTPAKPDGKATATLVPQVAPDRAGLAVHGSF